MLLSGQRQRRRGQCPWFCSLPLLDSDSVNTEHPPEETPKPLAPNHEPSPCDRGGRGRAGLHVQAMATTVRD
jgi:hypothetical protein